MILPKTNSKLRQRIAASARFYNVRGGRCDSILTERIERVHANDAERSIPLWFWKAPHLPVISIPDVVLDNIAFELGPEFCSVQYYSIMRKEELPLDGEDGCLNCVRLGWNKTSGEAGNVSAPREYSLIPCDSKRRRVHVIPASVGTTLIANTVQQKKELQQLSEENQ